eukprot:4919896-Pyramimonas_sp.AAC.1
MVVGRNPSTVCVLRDGYFLSAVAAGALRVANGDGHAGGAGAGGGAPEGAPSDHLVAERQNEKHSSPLGPTGVCGCRAACDAGAVPGVAISAVDV